MHDLLDAIDAMLDAIAQPIANRVKTIGDAGVAAIDAVEDASQWTVCRVDLVCRGLHAITMRCVTDVATPPKARAV
jgi:hypothetical protein